MSDFHAPMPPDGTPVAAPYVRQAGERRSARIESLRALAALGVLIGHSYGWSHHWQGVYATLPGRLVMSGGFAVFLFFSLSGYLLFLPFARAAFGSFERIDLRRYAVNRAVRILPLYYVVIGTYLVFHDDGVRSQWWRFLLFLQSFNAGTVDKVDGPAWSLVVEVQFYVLLPLFAWLVASIARRSLSRAAAVVGTLGIVALVVRALTVTSNDSVSLVWHHSLPGTCVFFFPGLLLALLRIHLDNHQRSWESARLVGSSTIWLLGGVALWTVSAYRYDYDYLMLPASALLLGACALPLRQQWLVRLLDVRLLAALGTASYSLYLWHAPIIEWMSRARWMPGGFVPLALVGGVACCLLAVVSYRVVEAPFLHLRRTWSSGRLPEQRRAPYGDVSSAAVAVKLEVQA
jgi:peptidoglycan/LPS O-acetylase OafA/YrhL